MLRKKDEQLLKDKRVVEMLKRLGKDTPEEYTKDTKSLTDSKNDIVEIDFNDFDEKKSENE